MKVVTFGEIMLRLAPHGYYRFTQAHDYEATFGGGEANVAVSLANYGDEARFVTKLPTHEIGDSAVNDLRANGVDTDFITRGGERVGIYFLEKGASQRASNVIYDRAHSSIATAKPEDFDWDAIFTDADWFHFTGITPALGDNVAAICEEACKVAKAKGVRISCDLNYRKKLWSTKEASETMTKLAKYIDVLIANEEDSEKVFGIKSHATDVTAGSLNREGYIDVAKQLKEKFNFEYVAITLRESITANDNRWGAMVYVDQKPYFSKQYDIHIVDRVGGGDSFAGGLIYALMHGYEPQEAVDFAVAASCLKHSIEGDYNRVSVAEVTALAAGDGTGRVQR
ncbi:sugar kinase [Erysipelothrix sp. HDW6C]|uniref:sugar kinase n=1 Tax=Erysipelothrix sp. HDW6C TaxID=2714930 RepID=UPI001407FF2B|nr:sugar kinase [Erysipelothrix sp. HDW6C]QIK69298.1 sugar kinase [Erysipelothrix sp. HDW6C]